jgi:predicted phage tail protein
MAEFKSLRGSGGSGKSAGGASGGVSESPNTLDSGSTASIIDLVSEGEIQGLVNGNQSIFLNGVALQNPDGSYNFNGVTVSTRSGTPNQDYLPGFASVENELAVGLQVRNDTPVTRTITDPDINRALVKIQIPALTYAESNGNVVGTSVSFSIYVQANGGGFTKIVSDTITGKTTSAYQCQYNIPLPAGGAPWDIKVERDSDDNPSLQLANATWWATYTEVIDEKIQYVDSACIGIVIEATQFGNSIPTRTYELEGILLQIPSNYDPIARTYTGLWDGTFKVAYSNNPAWVLYDLLTNARYGVGASMTAANIDKFALYAIGQYCDGSVPDGNGGMEPRYTFNGVINTVDDAYTVLNYIASSFRGMLYWSSGLVTATTDSPASARKLISPANVIGGAFTYTGTSAKARFSVAVVQYINPADSYNRDIVAYEDPELIQVMGWKPQNIVAYGCTSRGQAYRYAKWYIDTQKYSTEIVTFKVGYDCADLLPGQIFSIADPSYAGVRYGGRLAGNASNSGTPLTDQSGNPITDSNGNPITGPTQAYTLDQAITLEVGQTYTLSCVLPTGSIETQPISNPSDGSTTAVINIDAPFSQNAAIGAMWTVTASNLSPREFRVVSIKDVAKNIFEIVGVYYDPTKYARVEENMSIAPPNFSLLPTGPLAAPSALSIKEYLYEGTNGVILDAVTLSWSGGQDPRIAYYQVQMGRPTTGFWENPSPSTSSSQSLDIKGLSAGSYQFQVRAVSMIGTFSPWAYGQFSLAGLSGPPSDVSNFGINNAGAQSALTWDQVPDLNLSHYIVEYSPATSGATWGSSTILVDQVPATSTSVTVPTLIGTYLIKAVTTSGVESVNAKLIISNIGDINQENIVDTLTEDSSFLGVGTNTKVVAGTLQLNSPGSSGTYYFNNSLDMGATYTARVVPAVTAIGDLTTDTMSSWTTLSSITALSTADPSEWNVTTQIRTTLNDPWADASNVITFPYTFTDASWTKTHCSATSAATTAPDGTATGGKITEDNTASSTHAVTESESFSSGQPYTLSVYAKKNSRSFIELVLPSAAFSGNPACYFDLTAGTAGTPVGCTATCTVLGNGWVHCSITATASSTTSGSFEIRLATGISTSSYSGDGSSNLYLWQAQLTQAAAAYAPTWTSWSDVVIGDYTCRAMQFSAILESFDGVTSPDISGLAVTVDIPTRSEGKADVVTNGSGVSAITYANPFLVSPKVNITAHNMSTGDYYTITSKSSTGFTITFYNSSNAAVVRTFDWSALGYGRQI